MLFEKNITTKNRIKPTCRTFPCFFFVWSCTSNESLFIRRSFSEFPFAHFFFGFYFVPKSTFITNIIINIFCLRLIAQCAYARHYLAEFWNNGYINRSALSNEEEEEKKNMYRFALVENETLVYPPHRTLCVWQNQKRFLPSKVPLFFARSPFLSFSCGSLCIVFFGTSNRRRSPKTRSSIKSRETVTRSRETQREWKVELHRSKHWPREEYREITVCQSVAVGSVPNIHQHRACRMSDGWMLGYSVCGATYKNE